MASHGKPFRAQKVHYVAFVIDGYFGKFSNFPEPQKYNRDMKITRRNLISGLCLWATPSLQTQASVLVDMIMGTRRNFSTTSFREQIIIKHMEVPKWVQRVQQNNHTDPVCLLLGMRDRDKNSVLWFIAIYCSCEKSCIALNSKSIKKLRGVIVRDHPESFFGCSILCGTSKPIGMLTEHNWGS